MSDSLMATLKILGDVYDAFGIEAEPTKSSALYPLLADGRLTYDPAAKALEYRLAVPLELKNKDTLEVVRFREPAASELEYIRKPLVAASSLGDLADAAQRALIKTGDLDTGLAARIKARDLDKLQEVMSELGFFAR